jgi:hypothetical protein
MDPGLGAGFDANTLASLSDPGSAGLQQMATQQMAATRGLSQQPLTDQPSAAPPQQPQQAAQQAAPSQQRALTADDLAHAIFHGPAGPSGTPGTDPFSERFGATEAPASFAERFGASDPSNIYNNTASQRAYPSGGLPKLPPDPGPAAPMNRGDEFPNIDPSQNPAL